jgi:hypothetical protein
MTSCQPLFFSAPEFEKVAGYKLPSNPKLWESEIIRYLKSQHPYLQLDQAEIDLRRVDATKGAAVGAVIIGKEIAIPVIIKRPKPGGESELSPLDVFLYKGRYRYLDPDTVQQLSHQPQIGEPGPAGQGGGNPYIGDLTGSASPLEFGTHPVAGKVVGTKTAAAKTDSQEIRNAKAFGAYGALAAPLHMLGDRFEGRDVVPGLKPGSVATKGQLAKALGKRVARGSAIGAASAYLGTKALNRLDPGRGKFSREQRAEVKQLMRQEAQKVASHHTAGRDAVVEGGITARLFKHAYVDVNDVSRFRQIMATRHHELQGQGNNLHLVEMVLRRAPEARRESRRERMPNVVQVFKAPTGFMYIKFSGGPEQKTSEEELRSVFGDRFPEIMSRLDDGRVWMRHDGIRRATWDVERTSERPHPITGSGTYAVRGRGEESFVATVCQSVVHFDGRTLPLKLMVTPDGRYAVSPELFGISVSSQRRLPSQTPQAGQTGVFVTYIHGSPVVTTPVRMSSVRMVKTESGARSVYRVMDPITGAKTTLSPVPGVQGFERMRVIEPTIQTFAEGDVYYMPVDAQWVPLRQPVSVAKSADELTKLSNAERLGSVTHVTYGGGLFHVDAEFQKEASVGGLVRSGLNQVKTLATNPGQIGRGAKKLYNAAGGGFGGAARVAKHYAPGAAVLGTGAAAGYGGYKAVTASYQDLPEWRARELLVGMGMDQDDAELVMSEARSRPGQDRGVKLAGLHEPELVGHEEIEEIEVEYSDATRRFAESCRPSPELLKLAAESGHPETLDAVLSLEFITPQNLRYFVENIEDFDEAAGRLAALLVSVRLGLPHVPERCVKDALEGLTKTVSKLRILKSSMDHKSEQAASAS